jgi:hypothetical protein
MAGATNPAPAEIVAILRWAGLTLRVVDGELAIGGNPRALGVWAAMQQVIIGLEQVVAAELAKPGTESLEPSRPDAGDGSGEQPGGLEPGAEAVKPGSESEPESEPEPKPEPAATTESERVAARWAAFGSGADIFAVRLRGEPVPAFRTQNPMPWAPKAAPATYTPR